jgi:hypothetical protein
LTCAFRIDRLPALGVQLKYEVFENSKAAQIPGARGSFPHYNLNLKAIKTT